MGQIISAMVDCITGKSNQISDSGIIFSSSNSDQAQAVTHHPDHCSSDAYVAFHDIYAVEDHVDGPNSLDHVDEEIQIVLKDDDEEEEEEEEEEKGQIYSNSDQAQAVTHHPDRCSSAASVEFYDINVVEDHVDGPNCLDHVDDEIQIVLDDDDDDEEEEQKGEIYSPAVLDLFKAKKSTRDYCNTQNILLVGEGDFSFSASLALSFPSASNMVATSLNSRGISFFIYFFISR